MKRGYSYAEAIEYSGVKRRTFDELWRPRLQPMRMGATMIYDVRDLDRVFDEFKAAAAKTEPDAGIGHTGAGNERPQQKGNITWAERRGVSTPKPKQGRGRLTSAGEGRGFDNVVSRILMTRKGG